MSSSIPADIKAAIHKRAEEYKRSPRVQAIYDRSNKHREYMRKYREKPEIKEKEKEKYIVNKGTEKSVKGVLASIRTRARKANIVCSLTIDNLIAPNKCPVLGISLKQWGENTGLQYDSPTVDRIQPKEGYTPDNIRIISWRANKIKSDATIEEMELILAYMRANA